MSRAVPIALITLWLAAESTAFVPAFQAQAAQAGGQTAAILAMLAMLAPGQLVFHAAGAVIAGRALAELAGKTAALLWLLVLAGAIAAGHVFMVTGARDGAALGGLALGCALWWLLGRWREPGRGMAVVLLALAAYALGALLPFEIRNVPAAFNLVPFSGWMGDFAHPQAKALASSLLLYAGILGVLRINGSSPVPGSVALAILVALFEALHMLIGSRTPDITEPLLVLIVGQLLRLAPANATARALRPRGGGRSPSPRLSESGRETRRETRRASPAAGPYAAQDAHGIPPRALAQGTAFQVHGFVIFAYAVLIVYASLHPLTGWRVPAGPWWHFLTGPWPSQLSRADVVSNVLAYVPLGALLGWRLRARAGGAAAVFAATLIGTLLSLSVEITQVFLPSRSPSGIDLLTNALGTLIGAALAGLFRADAGLFRALLSLRNEWLLPGRLVSLGFGAFALWILSQWSPFVPSIDMSSLREGLAPIRRALLDPSLLRPYEAAAYALNILGLGLLLAALLKTGRPFVVPFAAAVGFVLLAKTIIVSRQLSLEAVAGLVLALLVLIPIRTFSRSVWIYGSALCLLAGFAAAELSPGRGAFIPFNWRPFAGELDNNINGFANILAGVWPFLALGCLAGFATPAHRRSTVGSAGALAVVTFAFLMEWMQQTLPGRHGDVTTVLLALGGWMLAWWWREPDSQVPGRRNGFSVRD